MAQAERTDKTIMNAEAKDAKEQSQGEFIFVGLETVPVDIPLPYGIFILVSESFVLLRGIGDTLTKQRLEKLKSHGVPGVYLRGEEWLSYLYALELSLTEESLEREGEKSVVMLRDLLDAYLKTAENRQELSPDLFQKIVSALAKFPLVIRKGRNLANALIRQHKEADKYFTSHAINIAVYISAVGLKLGLSQYELNDLVLAANLANIGNIKVPKETLYKPGPLESQEWVEVRKHPEHSYNLLNSLLVKQEILDAVFHHNERFDGRGYPHGISGNHIPLYSRIIAIAETFSALTSQRPWQKAYSARDAVALMQTMHGKFDPSLFELLTTT